MEIDATYEIAARTLGASSYTAARTISLPMLKSGIIASLILSFARSLSETGATLMVAGSLKRASLHKKIYRQRIGFSNDFVSLLGQV